MHDNLTSAPATGRNVAIGYLRAFVTLLVIAHHAVLAYHPYAPRPPATLSSEPILWPAFPVVDPRRWPGIDLFVGFNDSFFMALMFLISGVFVWSSLQRKGAAAFFGDRLRRLGIPFLVAAGLLAPVAYFPSYLQTGGPIQLEAFWQAWWRLPFWPSGPAWFLWVLLAFDAAAAALTRALPGWGDALGRAVGKLQRPAAFFWALAAGSALGYLPLALLLGPGRWVSFGPFSIQVSRAALYAVYFLAGVGLGARDLRRGLLASGGLLAGRWARWVGAALGAFALMVAIFLVTLSRGSAAGQANWALVHLTFTLSSAATSLALLALFVRFSRPGPIGDSLASSAYGMYLCHYVCVTWLQYALLRANLPGAAKAMLVFLGAVAMSWCLTAALRRIPAVGGLISSMAPSGSSRRVGASVP